MKNEIIEVYINPMQITSMTTFSNVNGRVSDFKKDVYFVRYIGLEEEKKYINDILDMDKQLNERRNKNKIGSGL